eukprot:GHVO01023356.1.p1 GENE.GHVO01023356.1~~GHVO01023356.1.p1  ORF type:complete len:444 (-),score=51.85 GHVO01023356.1:74-1405(-)
MVMNKVRATSFLRRTISEPFSRRRASISPHGGAPGGDLQHPLVHSGSSMGGKLAEEASFTWGSDMKGLGDLLFTKLNALLIFVPIGFIAGMRGWDDLLIFGLNFIAMVPLASLLGTATEELALHTGDLIGGLLNATFGNAVEMVITVQSLRRGLVKVVQGTLLGSILSNLLLVLGMSFLAGGLYFHVQKFNAQGAACSTSLLLLASLGIVCPTVTAHASPYVDPADILAISRYVALLIAATYCLFLFFQLHTHLSLFKDNQTEDNRFDLDDAEDVEEWPSLSASTSIFFLLSITLIIACQSEYLVGSIEGVVQNFHISEGFIGVILLPIVGNAAEHATAVTVAMKNKPDLTMGVAVGSSTQIAMFMVPFAVLVGWYMDVPMTLAFPQLSAAVLMLTILIVIGVVQDGESNWLEGVMLMVAYCIIAVVYWFEPNQHPTFGVPKI